MLAQNQRLRRPRDINRVYGRGRFGISGEVQVKVLANHMEFSRAAIVVSRKVSNKAVVRNRARRRLSGVLEQLWPTLSMGYDIVITARGDLSSAEPAALKRQLVEAFSRAGISA